MGADNAYESNAVKRAAFESGFLFHAHEERQFGIEGRSAERRVKWRGATEMRGRSTGTKWTLASTNSGLEALRNGQLSRIHISSRFQSTKRTLPLNQTPHNSTSPTSIENIGHTKRRGIEMHRMPLPTAQTATSTVPSPIQSNQPTRSALRCGME